MNQIKDGNKNQNVKRKYYNTWHRNKKNSKGIVPS